MDRSTVVCATKEGFSSLERLVTENEYHSICEELDILALKVLDLLQDIIHERAHLEESLKEGYVAMAKTRYIMGSQSVSMLQVKKTGIIANCSVVPEKKSLGSLKYHNFGILKSFEDDTGKQHSKSARLRHSVANSSNFNKILDEGFMSENKTSKETFLKPDKTYRSPDDSLKWFGVLVPQSLRACQSNFKDSISFALRIASMQCELRAVCIQYRELMAKKTGYHDK